MLPPTPPPHWSPSHLVFLRVVSDGLQMAHEEFQCLIVVSWEVPDLGRREKRHGTRLSWPPWSITPQRGSRCHTSGAPEFTLSLPPPP